MLFLIEAGVAEINNPKPGRMNRIDRLIAILTILQSKKFVSADFIADQYGISVRTVYRDIKALNEIGVPVYFEKDKGYSILQGFFLPPVSLTSEEANALILLVSLSEKFGDLLVRKNAENALAKIKSVLRSAEKEKADFLHSQIKVYIPPVETKSPDYLTLLQEAIINKQVLKIQYLNNRKEWSEREVEPIGLTFYSDQWHLIAWCWKRMDYRDFKVRKIQKVTNTQEPFRKEKHLSVEQYIKSLS